MVGHHVNRLDANNTDENLILLSNVRLDIELSGSDFEAAFDGAIEVFQLNVKGLLNSNDWTDFNYHEGYFQIDKENILSRGTLRTVSFTKFTDGLV